MNQLPQPLKTVYWAAYAAVIPLAAALLQSGSADGSRMLLFLPFPVLVATLGVILALDVRRNTSTIVEVARQEGRPVFSPRFGRLIGAGAVVAATLLVVLLAAGRG